MSYVAKLTTMKKLTQNNEEIEQLIELNKKIEVVIAVLLRLLKKDHIGIALKDQISLLDGLGVRPIEIAEIVGKTQSHVSKELVAIRRSNKNRS